MKREIHPAMAVAAVILIVLVAGGMYIYAGMASTRSGVDTSKGMSVQAAGSRVPAQQFVPKAN